MSTPGTTTSRWEPTPRWERRYREVLDAAATIFAEKGYAGASTRDIAELVQKSTSEAFKIVQDRMKESYEEIRKTVE